MKTRVSIRVCLTGSRCTPFYTRNIVSETITRQLLIPGGILSYFRNLLGSREMRILILGLDGAGKTTILYRSVRTFLNIFYHFPGLLSVFLDDKHYFASKDN